MPLASREADVEKVEFLLSTLLPSTASSADDELHDDNGDDSDVDFLS